MKLIQGDRIHTEQVGDTYKLSINKVGVRDYGHYYCRANNLLNKEVTAEIVLTGAWIMLFCFVMNSLLSRCPIDSCNYWWRDQWSDVQLWCGVERGLGISTHSAWTRLLATGSSGGNQQHSSIKCSHKKNTSSHGFTVKYKSKIQRCPSKQSSENFLYWLKKTFFRLRPDLLVLLLLCLCNKEFIFIRSGVENGYSIMGLHNNTYYNVMLRSQNKFGWSPFSAVFTFQTLDKLKLTLTLQEKPGSMLDSQGEAGKT